MQETTCNASAAHQSAMDRWMGARLLVVSAAPSRSTELAALGQWEGGALVV